MHVAYQSQLTIQFHGYHKVENNTMMNTFFTILAVVAAAVADVVPSNPTTSNVGQAAAQEATINDAPVQHPMNEFYGYRHLMEQANAMNPPMNHPNQEWIALGGFGGWGWRGCGCGGWGCGGCGFRRFWW